MVGSKKREEEISKECVILSYKYKYSYKQNSVIDQRKAKSFCTEANTGIRYTKH